MLLARLGTVLNSPPAGKLLAPSGSQICLGKCMDTLSSERRFSSPFIHQRFLDFFWDFPWISHGFPVDFPWISHGFPMDFPWIHKILRFPSRFQSGLRSLRRMVPLKPRLTSRHFRTKIGHGGYKHMGFYIYFQTHINMYIYVSITYIIYIYILHIIYIYIHIYIYCILYYIFVYLYIYIFVYLYIYIFIYLYIYIFIYLYIYIFIYLYIDIFIYIYIYLLYIYIFIIYIYNIYILANKNHQCCSLKSAPASCFITKPFSLAAFLWPYLLRAFLWMDDPAPITIGNYKTMQIMG